MMYLLLLIAASPVFAARTSTGVGDPKMSGVDAFVNWAKNSCEECDKTIGSLVTGLGRSQFLESSNWNNRTLSITLIKSPLYGQVALKSRLPVMWKLDKQVEFNFGMTHDGERKIEVKGMEVAPRKQGLELYETGLNYLGLDGANCVDGDCIVDEEQAVGKYLKENYDTKAKLEKKKGYLIDMLKNTYGSWLIKRAVNGLGKQRWGEIFYASIAISPLKITSFIIKNKKMGAIYEDIGDTRYTVNNIPRKMAVTFGNILRHKDREKSFANKYARSAINFARMMTYGQSNQLNNCGDVDAIANLFTWCEGTAPNKAPQCSGNIKGRIGWTPSPQK